MVELMCVVSVSTYVRERKGENYLPSPAETGRGGMDNNVAATGNTNATHLLLTTAFPNPIFPPLLLSDFEQELGLCSGEGKLAVVVVGPALVRVQPNATGALNSKAPPAMTGLLPNQCE